MTDRDDKRVRKALQGKDFPAGRDEVLAFATGRGEADERVLRALRALPEQTFQNIDDVTDAVPQRPEQADR